MGRSSTARRVHLHRLLSCLLAGMCLLLPGYATDVARAGESVVVTVETGGLHHADGSQVLPADYCGCELQHHGPYICPCNATQTLDAWCHCSQAPLQCTCARAHATEFSHYCCPCNPCPACSSVSTQDIVAAVSKAIEDKLPKQAAAPARPYDFTQFTSRRVRMYYYTDIRQLMTVLRASADNQLNECPSVESLVDTQRTARQNLLTAEAELQNLLANELQARNLARAQQAELDDTLSQLYLAEARLATATEAQKAASSSSTASAEQKLAASQALEQARNDLGTIQARLQPTQEQDTDPYTKVQKAVDAVSAAREKVASKRVELVRLRELELDAFAALGDNGPVVYRLGDDRTLDPLKRVSIFGLPDSHQLIVRGEMQDVELVCMDIKQELDEPVPQSTLAIWNLELNSSASAKGDEQVNRAFAEIEREFRETREQIDIVTTTLRDCIADEVKAAREDFGGNDRYLMFETDSYQLERLFVYDDEVLQKFGIDISSLHDKRTITSSSAFRESSIFQQYQPDGKSDAIFPGTGEYELSGSDEDGQKHSGRLTTMGLPKQSPGMTALDGSGNLSIDYLGWRNYIFTSRDPGPQQGRRTSERSAGRAQPDAGRAQEACSGLL
ncbi:MAG: hypothetical protein R3F46_01265 [bacterium]